MRSALARGDVVLVSFPFTDLSSTTVRPAIIIGRVLGDDVILALITSQTASADPLAEHRLDPHDPEFTRTDLRVTSLVRLDRIATLHRRLVQRRLGRIGPTTEEAVATALRHVLSI